MTFDRNYYLRPQTVQTDYAMLWYAMLWYGGRREAFYGETEAPRPLYAGGGAAAMGVGVVVGQERSDAGLYDGRHCRGRLRGEMGC